MRQIFHHIIRRFAVPPDVDQTHDVARGVQNSQLLDFPIEQRPIESSVMRVELDCDLLTGIFLVGQPDRSIGPVTERSNERIARDSRRGRVRLPTQFCRAVDLGLILNQCGVGIHACLPARSARRTAPRPRPLPLQKTLHEGNLLDCHVTLSLNKTQPIGTK